jgi:ParB/RepB/Spo0J family partition protein
MTQLARTTTTTSSGDVTLTLDSISVRENVRDLDVEHVAALAQSITLRGLLVPVIVRPIDGGHELVAGYHRFSACRQLGLADVRVVVREHEGSTADSAAENITSCRHRHDVTYPRSTDGVGGFCPVLIEE